MTRGQLFEIWETDFEFPSTRQGELQTTTRRTEVAIKLDAVEKLEHLKNWMALKINSRVDYIRAFNRYFETFLEWGIILPIPKDFVPSFEEYLKQVVPNTENWKSLNNYQ